eukprot:RCo051629
MERFAEKKGEENVHVEGAEWRGVLDWREGQKVGILESPFIPVLKMRVVNVSGLKLVLHGGKNFNGMDVRSSHLSRDAIPYFGRCLNSSLLLSPGGWKYLGFDNGNRTSFPLIRFFASKASASFPRNNARGGIMGNLSILIVVIV